jgi:dihydropyrimidinase
LNQFVALTATNHARIYGLDHCKGTIAIGQDADIALWDPERKTTVTAAAIHDNVGYTPYEGRTLVGWPVTVFSRGRIVVSDGQLHAAKGSGMFVARRSPGPFRMERKPNDRFRLFSSLVARPSQPGAG